MNDKLQGLIKQARRDLRRSSGIPLTAEEKAEEARNAEIEDLKESLLKAVGLKVAMELYFNVTWIDGSATADIKLDDRVFRIRKVKNSYSVRLVDGSSERELAMIDSKDPQFATRLLVAVGDALEST